MKLWGEGGKGLSKGFEVVLTWELEILDIVMGVHFHPLKGGCKKFYPVLPLPVINDKSLKTNP